MAHQKGHQTPGTKYRDVGGVIRTYGPPKPAPNPRTPGTQYRSPSGEIKTYGGAPQEGGGGGEPRDVEGIARQEYAQLPSIEDILRREEEARQSRLRQFVDPVLAQQKQVIEGLQGRPSIETFYNQLRQEKGVDQTEALLRALQQQSLGLEGEIGDLPQDVQRRTAGRLVTASQQQRILQKERDPLLEQLNDLLRGTERERAGYGDTLSSIQNALNIRLQQEGREIEPIQTALGFSGQNLDAQRQDEATRLQNLLSAIGVDRQTALQRIGDIIGGASSRESRAQEEAMIRLQAQLDQQSALEESITAGMSDADTTFLSTSAQDLAQRGVAPQEIVRILQGSKPNVAPGQIQALVELATRGFGAAAAAPAAGVQTSRASGGGGTTAGRTATTTTSAAPTGGAGASDLIMNSLIGLLSGQGLSGINLNQLRQPAAGQPATTGRQPLF